MSHRVRKLVHKLKQDGVRAAVGFVAHDLYFRALSALAFPFKRSIPMAGGGRDPFHEFVALMDAIPGGHVLEVGSRAVSDVTVQHKFSAQVRHTGLDVHPGPNVDVVGDAHELGRLFPAEQFDGIFSLSVFEHLLMPWVVVMEMNKVLKPGGVVMLATHPAWPPHELPWDFWRFQGIPSGRCSTAPPDSKFSAPSPALPPGCFRMNVRPTFSVRRRRLFRWASPCSRARSALAIRGWPGR
ncbi:MAG: methyltransferase domain-containing protein [Sulfuricaulis sp.]|nr:methyltransferase domain-containing protein [Sulfuricaulis sp.]